MRAETDVVARAVTHPVIALEEVGKTYPPGVVVLDGVTLEIEPGELVAIVGPSGSGKSTLLNIVGTLERPTCGTVRIAGRDASDMSDAELARLRAERLGFIFQSFFLIESMTALENVVERLIYAGVPARHRREMATQVLDRVGLAHRCDHPASKLSGGEQQRVAIARALVTSPSLILADEPTGNLDSATGAAIVDLLHDLHDQGHTIVVITHDTALTRSFPRRVEMLDGRIAHDTRRTV